MVAELRYLLGFLRSPSETVARGRTQTPSRENTFFGFLGSLLGLPFRGSGSCQCSNSLVQGSFGEI